MNLNTVFCVLFITLGFASWPVIGKWSGVSGAWFTSMVVVIGTLPVLMLSAKQMAFEGWPFTTRTFAILVIASLVNGFAVYVYGLKAGDVKVPTGLLIASVSMMNMVWATTLDWLINKQALSTRQGIGLVIGSIALFLLRK